MTLLRISLLVMCLATLNLFGQTIQITDDSPSGSPITFQGTMTFDPNDEFHIPCSIMGHNRATRQIVAYSVSLNVLKPTGEPQEMGHTRDLFFHDKAILAMHGPRPGTDFHFPLDCGAAFGGDSWGSNHVPFTPPASAEAHVKTVFVQFSDGSTWGDDKVLTEVMFQRADAWAYLKSLKAVCDAGADAALDQALQVDLPLRTADYPGKFRHVRWEKRHELLKLQDIKAEAAELDKILAAAQAHAAWLK